MSKKQKENSKLFELDDALMQMFPEKGRYKKNKSIFSMDEIMQKVFPSAFIMEYWQKVKFKPKVKDIALIIANNNDYSLYLKLLLMKSLAKVADNEESKKYIQQYLEEQINQLRMFQKKEEGTLFELQVSYGQDWFSLALMENLDGLVYLGNMWKNSPCHKNENVKFMIYKRLVYDHPVFTPKKNTEDKDKDKDKDKKKTNTTAASKAKNKEKGKYPYLPENKGCITLTDDFYIESCEYGYSTGIDFESWTIGCFSVPSDDFYKISFPMPFHKGDIVHNVVGDNYGVVSKLPSKKKDSGYYPQNIQVLEIKKNGTMNNGDMKVFNLEIVKENDGKQYRLLKRLSEQVMGKKINISEFVNALYYYVKDNKGN